MFFTGTASAGNGIFVNNGGTSSSASSAGTTEFRGNSTAGNGTFRNNGGATKGARGGAVGFLDTSSAGNATLIANGGAGGGAGGSIQFFQDATGGTPRVEVYSNGNLTIGSRNITVGSIQGDGDVFLGVHKLTVGSNNLNTNFSGVIKGGGSLAKIGRGKLVLRNTNTYTGGTTIKHGTLIVSNRIGSATGSSAVLVNGGSLGGKGIIAGAVTVGTRSGPGAVLSPGYQHGTPSPGALTIQSPLTFNSDATYEVGVNSTSAIADEVVALGVTINSGALFSFSDIGSASLPAGTVFTIMNNTASTPIAGTFSKLADGSTFTSNGNTYKVNYQGGDGNDLTLTVVP